ncbi:MAG: cyclic nucleotide-binding domain-containing protein [Nitrospirae bacterium]|nr:cyclic nucleotide-binding domain-containing protein [Nitrospirota bacterium]
MMYFGNYLIGKKLVTEEDVLDALKYQSEKTPSFIELACKFSFLDMKQVYEILTYQAHTDLAFEEVALRRRAVTEEQFKDVIAERERLRPHIGDVLVYFGKISEDVMLFELGRYTTLKESFAETSGILARFSMFEPIGKQALDSLAYIVEKRTCKPFEMVLCEGGPAESFYCVVSGTLKVTRKHPVRYAAGDSRTGGDSKDVYLYRLEQNDVFGISALFEGEYRNASVTNEDDETVLLCFHRDDFMEFLREHPKASHHVLLYIIRRMGHMLKMAGQELIYERTSFMSGGHTDSIMDDIV